MPRLPHELVPSDDVRERVRARVMRRIQQPHSFTLFARLVEPSQNLRQIIWSRVLGRIQLAHQPAHAYRFPKWVVAAVIVLVGLRASPVLFLAPNTSAESPVIVLPTRGEVSVAVESLWQPLKEEITIEQSMRIRTGDGEATVLLHDDGTLRLAPYSTVTLVDLSDRPEAMEGAATLVLEEGRVWVQGLLPDQVTGLTVFAPGGEVLVHGGSVSLMRDGDATVVRVWDRHARVHTDHNDVLLVAGEGTEMRGDVNLTVRRIADSEYEEAWVAQNLQRDAVHQREVAQMQQERRAARAGILPTSPLYPVKRVAEQVDVLLTIGSQARLQKKLDQASTRLDEAAVLLAEGNSGASLPLEEYRTALLEAAASSSGSDLVKQELIKQLITENAADVAAALPNDNIYLVKQTVLTAAADLPGEVIDESDVEGTLLLDRLDVLREAVETSDGKLAKETYDVLKLHLVVLNETGSGALKPDVQKEVVSLLKETETLVREQDAGGVLASGLADELASYIPLEIVQPVLMTEEQLAVMVQGMYDRIFYYKMQRSRWNQLELEIRNIEGHFEEGRILRRLYHALPEDGLARYVRTAIQELRERQEQKLGQ